MYNSCDGIRRSVSLLLEANVDFWRMLLLKTYHTMGNTPKHKAVRTPRYVFVIRWVFVIACALALITSVILLITPSSNNVTELFDDNAVMGNGITIDGIDVSGLRRQEAEELLLDSINERLSEMALRIKVDTRSYMFTAADAQVSTNLDDVITAALAYNKNASVLSELSDSVIMSDSAFETSFSVDEEELLLSVDKIAALFNIDACAPYAEPNRNSLSPEFIYHEGTAGRHMDEEALAASIVSAVSVMDSNAVIQPVFDTTESTVTIDEVRGSIAQRSVFKTYYDSGSLKAASRVHNVKKGADILNGCVIAPGEEFSFNDYIGPRTYDGGWEAAPGIVNGSMYEMQAGGGICQVSTTLHNAVMLAGPELEVTLRKNHSWPSSYVDYGLDATVSTGGPDFKFVNNTDSPIYIFAYADNVNYIMTVYIYGKPLPDGISYNVYATTDEVIEPEETLIVEEETWPLGYTREIIKSRKGYKTTAYRDTLMNGDVIDTEVLYHYTYRAVRGETHVGTGDPELPVPVE